MDPTTPQDRIEHVLLCNQSFFLMMFALFIPERSWFFPTFFWFFTSIKNILAVPNGRPIH